MNIKPNHTSLPWKFRASYSNGEPQGYVVQSGIKVIADLCCSPEDLSVEEANAEFICRAVNSHDELLAALRTIDTFFDSLNKESAIHVILSATFNTNAFAEHWREVRAAITKAKENQ